MTRAHNACEESEQQNMKIYELIYQSPSGSYQQDYKPRVMTPEQADDTNRELKYVGARLEWVPMAL